MSHTNYHTVPERLIFNFASLEQPSIPLVLCDNIALNIKCFLSQPNVANRNYLIVCDNAIHDIIGKKISLTTGYELLLLGENPSPDPQTAKDLAEKCEPYDCIIALGSNTVNNISKYAAKLINKPYIIIPTAPSTTSYTSSTALLNSSGVDKLYDTNLPEAVYIDPELVSNAPIKLILNGISECIALYTSELDWLASNSLCQAEYDSRPYDFVSCYLNNLVMTLPNVRNKNKNAVLLLMECLLACGFAINLAKEGYKNQSTNNILKARNNIIRPIASHFYAEHNIFNTILIYRLQKTVLQQNTIMYQEPVTLANAAEDLQQTVKYKNNLNFRDMNYKFAINKKKIHERFAAIPDIAQLYRSIGISLSYRDLFISKSAYLEILKTAAFTTKSINFLDIIVYGGMGIAENLL